MKQMHSFFFAIVTFLVSSCNSTTKITLPEKRFVQHESLIAIPDSVIQDKTITKIILSPSWVIEGVLGTAPDVPGKNNITKLPDDICKLKRLRVLDLCMNDIKELPNCFEQLENLEDLDLSYNRSLNMLDAMPKILRLKKLKKINLYGIKSVVGLESMIREKLNERKIKMILTRSDMLGYIEHK